MRLTSTALVMFGAIAVFAPACSSDVADDEDMETEPVESSEDAIVSDVDCRTTRQTAFDQGRPSNIDVIKIGGKNVSRSTGHAFLEMQRAAHQAGVRLTISSGFRTNAEQQYFYNCYQTRRCNSGNLAARPGFSNHQNGRALDLATSSWLANNAARFGFKRTVPSEAWHYEFFGSDPGGPCSAGGSGSTNGTSPATPPPANPPAPTDPPAAPGSGAACSNDGACNPGSNGSGQICEAGRCVAGCRSNAQCPGATSCVSGQCR